jgi:hypothetical protein
MPRLSARGRKLAAKGKRVPEASAGAADEASAPEESASEPSVPETSTDD